MRYIKFTLSILAIFGLLIALGELLGRFKDQDRIDFANAIGRDMKCTIDHPGAIIFIRDSTIKNPIFKELDIKKEIESVVFIGLLIGGNNSDSAFQVNSITAGDIVLRRTNGQLTIPLCSYEDMKRWSKETPLWKWLGWGIVAVSVLLGLILLIIEEFISKKPKPFEHASPEVQRRPD